MVLVRNLRLGPTAPITVAVALLALLAAGAALAAPRISGPQAEITSGPPDELFIRPGGTTTATWEFTANQPGARFTCKFKGSKVHPCRSPITFSRARPRSLHIHRLREQPQPQPGHDPRPRPDPGRQAQVAPGGREP